MKTYTKKNEKTIRPYVAKAIKDYLIKIFNEKDGYELDENIPVEAICNNMFIADYGDLFVTYTTLLYPFVIHTIYDFELDHLVIEKADLTLNNDREQIIGLYSTRKGE